MFGLHTKSKMIAPERALKGRAQEMSVAKRHTVLGTPPKGPFPEGLEQAVVGMGCFWGAERLFWQAPGAYTTAVGYAGGFTPNPTYEEVCSGRTGHTEAVLIVFDPAKTSYNGDPAGCSGRTTTRPRACARATTVGTQYPDRRSTPTSTNNQRAIAEASATRTAKQHERLRATSEIRTEIALCQADSTTPRFTASSTSEENPWGSTVPRTVDGRRLSEKDLGLRQFRR